MDRIIKYIDTNQDNILSDLKDLVAVPSESDDHEKVKEALRLALKIAEDNGLKAYSVLDEQVGIVELGEGPETLGIVTHVGIRLPGGLELQYSLRDIRIDGTLAVVADQLDLRYKNGVLVEEVVELSNEGVDKFGGYLVVDVLGLHISMT